MTDYREILRLRSLGLNNSQIAESTATSRPTVISVIQRATALGIDWPTVEGLTDRELAHRLYPPGDGKPAYKMPDYAYVHREMARKGVTLQLLWFEYNDKCRDAAEIPYQLTQFKKYYRDFVVKTKATMHIDRKPGEIMEVDWAGTPAEIINTDTGEVMDAFVFVSALPYSGYAYAEAFFRRNQEAWITAHVNTYKFFGGVTRILVPDNLKTGVVKNTREETVLNKTYQDLAEHYGTAIIPARVRAPKDKSTVEGTVGNITAFILASIRNQQFFSLQDLNAVIQKRLHTFNHKPFQKKDGTRALLFAEEKAFLLPLPKSPFELAEWKIATVQYNYCISVDAQFYSVPYEYIKHKVDVRLTSKVVEVFFEGNRICSHVRLRGCSGQYSILDGHMPPSHRQYTQWNGERFRNWAAKIGANTAAVVESILTANKVEQQGYRACMALLKLSDQYTPQRLEAACTRALRYTPRPNYKAIQAILKSGQDKIPDETAAPPEPTASRFGFSRGADYFGRGRK
jgi:transposase